MPAVARGIRISDVQVYDANAPTSFAIQTQDLRESELHRRIELASLWLATHDGGAARLEHGVSWMRDQKLSRATMSAADYRLVIALFFSGMWNFADTSQLNSLASAAGTTRLDVRPSTSARTFGIRYSNALRPYITPPTSVRSTSTYQTAEKFYSPSSTGKI